ncbi:hypothetical protein SAMN04487870_2402 [Pseudoalteromonas sp. DSM 26666]|uniref:hypothetical protein n=1 Tax=Pseudoalteromonas sp. DSM 26666 TaxID=1761892 RepID=UPI0008EAAE7C|nr:hypothetical protein [Pseudoalteromonas sp. DSM 26666]SFT92506.1 hypothetical protein SAMN04487870_2402 [Pseudoalteromonas sp. DSM 26666]
MSKTKLVLEYCERTKDIEYSDELEELLEKDYIANRAFYTDKVFNFLYVRESIFGVRPAENIELAKVTFSND